jgi:hypothetical protein
MPNIRIALLRAEMIANQQNHGMMHRKYFQNNNLNIIFALHVICIDLIIKIFG